MAFFLTGSVMNTVTFNAIGLKFYADVRIKPEIPARLTGNPDNWCEGKPMEVEIKNLYADGDNADFLLWSDVGSDIEDACYEACRII